MEEQTDTVPQPTEQEAEATKSDLEKWQHGQIDKAAREDNPLIKECRTILATAPIIEPATFPREEQRLAIVAPVYREWNNGHIIDQLDSLAQQSADKQTFSIALVINNGPEAPKQTVAENQLTVDVVRYLAGQTEELEDNPQISQTQREKLTEIRASGLNVIGIDLTAGVEKHMGKIRAIGSTYSLERALPSTKNTYLAWMDADSQVEPQYCQSVTDHLSQNPEINALYLPFSYYPEGSRETFESSYRYRFDMTDRYFRTVLFPTVEKAVGGPFIVAKAEVWSEVIKNFPPRSEKDEDFIASRKLFASGSVDFYPDTVVSTADRAYEEGFDAKIRQEAIEAGSARNEWEGIDVRIFRQLVSLFDSDYPPNRDQFVSMFQFCNIPYNEEVLNQLALEQIKRKVIIGESVDLLALKSVQNDYFTKVGVAIAHDPQGYAESARQFVEVNLPETEKEQVEKSIIKEIARENTQATELRKGVSRVFDMIKHGTAPKQIDDERIQKRIPWIAEEISSFEGSNTEFIKHLEKEFPDVFLENSENTQIRYATAALRGIMLFLFRARIDGPERYPGTHKIWETLTEGIK